MLFPWQDKILHVGAYLYFYIVGWAAWRRRRAWSHGLFWGLAGYGIAIELLQGLTGYRDRDPMDLLANAAGLCLGVGAVVFYCRKHR